MTLIARLVKSAYIRDDEELKVSHNLGTHCSRKLHVHIYKHFKIHLPTITKLRMRIWLFIRLSKLVEHLKEAEESMHQHN